MHAWDTGQQVGDAGGLQAVDVGAGEDGIGGAGGGARLDLAVGADQDVGQFQGVVAFSGQERKWQAQEGGGEARDFHGQFRPFRGTSPLPQVCHCSREE
ncbi:hypothetical protein D3C78_1768420 [compost metagenome]